ncbi:HTH-type transcriptional activator RhaR [anaerobic digester metagenome]
MDTSTFHGNLITTNRILYTPSVFAKANLIHLQEIGELQAQMPHTSKRENLSSYLFFIVMDGSGTLEYNNEAYSLSTGDCVFIDCQKPYSHRSSENLWTLKWAHFYGPNMNGIYEKYAGRGGRPCFHPSSIEPYTHILQQLHDLAASSDYIKDMRIYEKLTALLTLLMEQSWNPEIAIHKDSKKLNLQKIKEYLDQHYPERITLDTLAEEFYINKFYLTRIFKNQFGISINNYLLQVRITHAKQLLRFTDLPIEAIAHTCGMSDANYFSRMFKKIEGLSPGDFRKLW